MNKLKVEFIQDSKYWKQGEFKKGEQGYIEGYIYDNFDKIPLVIVNIENRIVFCWASMIKVIK